MFNKLDSILDYSKITCYITITTISKHSQYMLLFYCYLAGMRTRGLECPDIMLGLQEALFSNTLHSTCLTSTGGNLVPCALQGIL